MWLPIEQDGGHVQQDEQRRDRDPDERGGPRGPGPPVPDLRQAARPAGRRPQRPDGPDTQHDQARRDAGADGAEEAGAHAR